MRPAIALAVAAGCLAAPFAASFAAAQEIPVSRWGAEDEIGAANHLSPAKVQEALRAPNITSFRPR